MALFAALEVGTCPATFLQKGHFSIPKIHKREEEKKYLVARGTRLSTLLLALGVDAKIGAPVFTRRTLLDAWFPASVGAHKDSFAEVAAFSVHEAATAAGARTGMPTWQFCLALLCAANLVNRHGTVRRELVSTRKSFGDRNPARSAFFTTSGATGVPAL